MQKFTPFLMFTDRAEEAMNFYTSVFQDSKIISIQKYNANEPGVEGTVKHAIFSLGGQEFMCIDGGDKHAFSFTPSMSIYVNCNTEAEIDAAFAKLSEGGQIMMALGEYPFSKRYCWVADKFGVSWQLGLR